MNPAHTELAENPEEYRWSHFRAHMEGKNDELAKVAPGLFLSEERQSIFYSDSRISRNRANYSMMILDEGVPGQVVPSGIGR
jgi:hypothetical protein